MGSIGPTFVTVVGGIIGLAIVAVLVSQKAQTSTVFTGAGTALATVINAAVSPLSSSGGAVTGGTVPAGVTQ
jgi:PRD1 phage membrane DNA delivery